MENESAISFCPISIMYNAVLNPFSVIIISFKGSTKQNEYYYVRVDTTLIDKELVGIRYVDIPEVEASSSARDLKWRNCMS